MTLSEKGSALKGKNLLQMIPSEKESTLKGKNLHQCPLSEKGFAPLGANSFLLEKTPFQKGTWCAGKQVGSHKTCLT